MTHTTTNGIMEDALHNERLAEKFYLEWVNDFLTVARFAEYHGTDIDTADKVITLGKKVNCSR